MWKKIFLCKRCQEDKNNYHEARKYSVLNGNTTDCWCHVRWFIIGFVILWLLVSNGII